MAKIEMVLCLNCHVKTNKSFPLCGHCGKSLSGVSQIGGVMKSTPPARPMQFRYGEQLVVR